MRRLVWAIKSHDPLLGNALEVTFANDANLLTPVDQLFRFAMLRTPFLIREFTYILVAHDK